MPRRWHSSVILVAVFALGLAAGIVGMVWAWPGVRAHMRHTRRNETFAQYMQRTLSLTPAEMPQVRSILADNAERRHQIHLQFVPAYSKVCDEFTQIAQQEHDTYVPVRQNTLDKLKAALTPEQWQKFQQERAANRTPPRKPDLCRHLPPAPPAH